MKRYLILISTVLMSCSPAKKEEGTMPFSLRDFYGNNQELDKKVEQVFQTLDARAKIGQMIVTSAGPTGKPTAVVEKLLREKAIGGILLLSGEKQSLMMLRKRFDSLAAASGTLPIIYSSDAEPSLINRKIKGTTIVPKTVELQNTARCDSVARIIASDLLSMNIRHNFAPVLDMSPNNEAITNRTFGNDSATVVSLASTYVRATQEMEVAATVKHFPGHGLVSGDTHHSLVAIDGEMKEVANYKPLIGQGVISVMVGHIAVVNNEKYQTGGLPASCSRVIVHDLLREELGFRGIVVTDAMNMGALSRIDKASLKAVQAGCDMILMEPHELKSLNDIYELYRQDRDFQAQVDASVKRILRLKACLNLL